MNSTVSFVRMSVAAVIVTAIAATFVLVPAPAKAETGLTCSQLIELLIAIDVIPATKIAAARTICGNVSTTPLPTPVPSLALFSPNGGETWNVGESREIRWTTVDATSPVTIDAIPQPIYCIRAPCPSPGEKFNISSGVTSSMKGSFVWKVGTDAQGVQQIVQSGSWKITIRQSQNSGSTNAGLVIDESDKSFTIAMGPVVTDTKLPYADLKVLQGQMSYGEKLWSDGPIAFPAGSQQQLIWRSGNVGTCAVSSSDYTFYKYGTSGDVMITVPAHAVTYSMQCTNYGGSSVIASDTIEIRPSTATIETAMTISSPKSGASWITGENQLLQWTDSRGFAGHTYAINVHSPEGKWVGRISDGIVGAGTYTWNVGKLLNSTTTLAPGSYRIYVGDITQIYGPSATSEIFTTSTSLVVAPTATLTVSANGQTGGKEGIRVPKGTTVTLNWFAQNVDTCSLANGYDLWALGTSGIKTHIPTQTNTTYTLECFKDGIFVLNRVAYVTIDAVTSAQNITLLSPNGGGYWYRGNVETVTWKTANIPSSNVMLIRLRGYSSGQEYNLVSVFNTGSATVGVPLSLPLGAYTLEVKTAVGDQSYIDASDSYFKVIDTQTSAQNITLLSPNGGETYKQYDAMAITWKKTEPSSSTVSITLYDTTIGTDNDTSTTISSSASNTGSYEWRIPATVAVGKNYKITVSDNLNGKIFDTSDANFSIIGAAIPVACTGIGDIDGDGKILASDSLYVARYVAGTVTLTSDQACRADANRDGRVDAADTDLILKASVGSVTLPYVSRTNTTAPEQQTASLAQRAQNVAAQVLYVIGHWYEGYAMPISADGTKTVGDSLSASVGGLLSNYVYILTNWHKAYAFN